ncbi:MAG TPA: AMP-binding protein [Kineosporiaceae bacterium]
MGIDWLQAYGSAPTAPVFVLPTGQELDAGRVRRLVDEVVREFTHPDKSLVLCLGDRDLGSVVAYLAAMRAGHAVAFLTGARGGVASDVDLVKQYEPEYVVPSGAADTRRAWMTANAGRLRSLGYAIVTLSQPDLTLFRRISGHGGAIPDDVSLLLGTSGTTGSPQAVVLSRAGLLANVDAIVDALGMTGADRAITSLPIRHSYGLSVLNTHLRVGAATVLTDERPSATRFWDQLSRYRATSFAAVPTTYQFLADRHAELIASSRLRSMTQAGGRLADDLVLKYWTAMHGRGGRFFVMYGQTEATARMSVLDPAELPGRLGSVGQGLPGARFVIDESVTEELRTQADRRSGEICYEGPGIMLGYATDRADLGQAGAAPSVLRTGDLGYLDDGFLYVTGRTKRIAKLFGQRVSLDEIERLLPADCAAVSDDRTLYIATSDATDAVRDYPRTIAALLDVPERMVVVRTVEDLPRTHSGKTNYPAVLNLVTGGLRPASSMPAS